MTKSLELPSAQPLILLNLSGIIDVNIVAITGMPGARKSDVARYFGECGIVSANMSTVLRQEVDREGLSPTSQHYHSTALRLRQDYGEDVLAERTLPALKEPEPYCVVDGIRTSAEANYFASRCQIFRILGIHANQDVRFARMRSRSGKDLLDWQSLVAQDEHNFDLGVGTILAKADYIIINGAYVELSLRDAVKVINSHILKEIEGAN